MSFDIFGTLRDVLVIGYLFVLRIGVPLLITFLLGAWLQKVLQEPGSAPPAQRALMARETHCWDGKNAPADARAQAAAAQHPELPCWLALQVSGLGLRDACRTCSLFTSAVPAAH